MADETPDQLPTLAAPAGTVRVVLQDPADATAIEPGGRVKTATVAAIFGARSTSDLPEGSNLYFTGERVDDRVASLLVAGANVTLAYDDAANTLTIASSGGGGGGSGTVTAVSVATANGLAGTVANPTTTPAITLTTSVAGVLKGDGTAISAAVAGTDYVAPSALSGYLTTTAAATAYQPLNAALTAIAGLAPAKGAIAVYNGSAWAALAAGADGKILSASSAAATGLAWVDDQTGAGGTGIASLNTLTGSTQTFATGTAGTDFGISSSGTVHTFNIPDAGATARGLVTTGAQVYAGVKTLTSPVIRGAITNDTQGSIICASAGISFPALVARAFSGQTGDIFQIQNSGGTKLVYVTAGGVVTGDGGGLTALNASNLSSGTVATARLGTGTASATTYLRGDGTWATPAGSGSGTVTSVDVSGGTTGLTATGGPVTGAGTITLAGTLAAASGGTGQASYTVGDLLYASSSAALSKLAGNISTTKMFLTQAGAGASANAPAWGPLAAADIPNIAESQVTNLTADLAAKAPLANPTFTGTVTASVRAAAINAAADGATVTFDLSLADTHAVTLGGNRTLALSNAPTASPWRRFTLILTQDATGSRTVTWFSGISWAGGTAPTLTTAAGKRDVVTFLQVGNGAYLGFLAGANL